MKAVILAGGEGTRLRPLTSNQPKPMMPIANAPMMEHIVRLLAKHGFDDIVVTVAFLANHIRNYFGDGSEFGVRMRYATEESPLGTAGSVRNAMDELDETFLVISGDVVTDFDLSRVMKEHRAQEAFASIALKRVENPVEFGIVITHDDGTIERFLEKPTWGEVFSDTINTGIYVLEPEIFDYIAADTSVDFSGDVFPAVLEEGRKLHGQILDGYWEDVGTLEAYRRAHDDILDGRVAMEIEGFEVGDGVWLGEGADLSPDAEVHGPVLVGDNCRVEAGAVLRPYTVLGADVVVKTDAELERCVIHDHVYIGPGVRVRGAVVGRASDLRDGARVEENAVIGDECFVGAHAIVNPSVKIYPFKTVEPGALVTSSIVWESKGARTLFGRRGVRGLANVDVTSEVAVRLAMAYGTALKKGSVVCTSRDTSRSARALKRAMIAGLNLAGVHVMDLELSTVPLTRFQVRSQRAQGGISVRLASGDSDSVEIRFIDANGADIDEGEQRKIERLLYREDFRRAFAGDIGDILFPPRAMEFYTAALEASVDAERLRRRSFKVVLDYSYGAASNVMPSVLAKIGAAVLAVNPFATTLGSTATPADLDERIKVIGDLVRTSGLRPRVRVRSRRRDRDDHRRPGRRADARPGAARADQAGVRASPRCPARIAGLGEPRSRTTRNRRGRIDRLDQALGRAPDGRRRQRGNRLRRFARRRVHLAVVPARVRRGRHARAPARPAGRRGSSALGRARRGARDLRCARAGADAVGTQGRGDARRDGAREAVADGARRRGEDRVSRRVGARAARP
jgi:mannose-1-phosphate guanylyltransferase/phosphomannomutase